VKLRVSNFNPSLKKEDLEEIFEEFGRVMSVKMFKDKASSQANVLAFVEMRTQSAAEDAIDALNGTDLDGFSLKVELSHDKISKHKPIVPVPSVDPLLDDDEEGEEEDKFASLDEAENISDETEEIWDD